MIAPPATYVPKVCALVGVWLARALLATMVMFVPKMKLVSKAPVAVEHFSMARHVAITMPALKRILAVKAFVRDLLPLSVVLLLFVVRLVSATLKRAYVNSMFQLMEPLVWRQLPVPLLEHVSMEYAQL